MDIAKDDGLVLMDEEGNKIEATILFTFETDAGNHYMVLAMEPEGPNEPPKAWPVRYIPNDPEGKLMPVEGEEWEEVSRIYQMICEEVCRQNDEEAPGEADPGTES